MAWCKAANLLFDDTAILAREKVLLDLLSVFQIEFAINVGVEKLGHLVVIDTHLV